tara:strand:+ start:153 stop:782 length:630 start_codon:yes stop_codon:yes gene_type:complete
MKFYLISPPKINKNFNHEIFDKVTDIISVNFFQFRPKYKSLSRRFNFVSYHYKEISKICKKKKIKLIINNDFEIAEKFIFDGIHLGQKDKNCKEAKINFGSEFIVGVSCSNSYSLYIKAKNQKADYVAFGPVFKTLSKTKKKINFDKAVFALKKLRLPFTLIGGINHTNFMELVKYKPFNLAMIKSIWDYEKGPVESALVFKKILNKAN